MPHWLFGSHEALWRTCAAQFARQGVVLPEWPACLVRPLLTGLRIDGPGCYYTAGWGSRRSWAGRIDHWVQEPDVPRAWLGNHQLEGEPVVEAAMVTPRMGLFMRHRLSDGPQDLSCDHRVQDAYRLAGRLLSEAEQLAEQSRWPTGLRLMLVDDDLDLARWGWLQGASLLVEDPLPDVRVMRASHAASLEVLSVLDKLADPMTDSLIS